MGKVRCLLPPLASPLSDTNSARSPGVELATGHMPGHGQVFPGQRIARLNTRIYSTRITHSLGSA